MLNTGIHQLGSLVETHERDGTYFVDENEIRTLRMYSGEGPVLIGLIRLVDVQHKNELYLSVVEGYLFNTVKPVLPTTREVSN